VLGTEFAQALQVALGRDQHTGGTSYRLHDHGGNGRGVVQGDDALQFVRQVRTVFGLAPGVGILFQVVRVRQMVDARQQRAIMLAVASDAADGNTAKTYAMVATLAADQADTARFAARLVVGQRNLERRIHRFRAGIGIKHVAEFMAGVVHQLFGQVERGRVAHLESGRKIKLADHFAHRADDFRLGMPARHAP
jgi:hypothetical protein